MPAYVAFLRAVNVGGRMVKMAALRERLEQSGFTEVETYIASGNVKVATRLRTPAAVEKRLEALLLEWLDFDVPALVRTPAQLAAVHTTGAELAAPLAGSPRHYVAFLRDEPEARAASELETWDQPDERAVVVGREAHLWLASDRPKLTNTRMEKILDTVGTARDWKTVTKLAGLWT